MCPCPRRFIDRVGSLSSRCGRGGWPCIIIGQGLPAQSLYKEVDVINIAILTCQNYSCKDANGVEREQERTLSVKDLSHVNYNPAQSDKNVVLEHDSHADNFTTFRAFVKNYKEQEGISGRFNVDTASDRNATKVLSCFVMSGSHDLIAGMTRTEQVEYFRAGLDFLKTEYPTFHVVDARIHYDEQGLPHLHTSMLPIHVKEDGSKSFNVSQHQKGKDYFRGFQDRFFEYMRERYPDKNLQRTDPAKDHDKKLSVKEYKENQDLKHELEQERQRLLAKSERLKDIDRQLDIAFEQSEKAYRYNLAVERYCQAEGLTLTQYEKAVFWADRGYGEYPDPERDNPDRQLEQQDRGLEHHTDKGERER